MLFFHSSLRQSSTGLPSRVVQGEGHIAAGGMFGRQVVSDVRSTEVVLSDYSKLPPSPPVDQVFLLDPLIATGGTACAALAMIVDWGIPGMFFTV